MSAKAGFSGSTRQMRSAVVGDSVDVESHAWAPITSRLVITIDEKRASSMITAGPLPCQPSIFRRASSSVECHR